MTGAERQTLDQLYQLVGSTAGKVDMILLSVGGIEERLRKVELAAEGSKAVAENTAEVAKSRTISKQWLIGLVLGTVLGTATLVLAIVK